MTTPALPAPTPLAIRSNRVYTNDTGEERLVVSVESFRKNPVVCWRTTNPRLPSGVKAQGSATVASFRRWADGVRVATKEDWEAFQKVERRREWDRTWRSRENKAVQRIKERRGSA